MMLSNELFDTFHYKSYGTFCLHEKRPIISIVGLPTTEIIVPFFLVVYLDNSLTKLSN